MVALKSLEDLRFEASLGCKARLSPPPNKQTKHTHISKKRKRKKRKEEKRKARDLIQ